MKALILQEEDCLEFREAPDPEIGPEDVLVAVKACGICGSDVKGLDGSTGRRRPPLIMGHEASGVIAEVGESVAGWSRGERVTFDSTVYCGECAFCTAGDVHLCDERRVLGVSCRDYRRDGAFAEYVAVPQRILYALPDGLSFEHAATVEPLSVAVHAVHRLRITLGDTAVVVGCGMIGLLAIQVLRAAGCGRIFAADIDPSRLELAGRLGADETFQANQVNVRAEVFQKTDDRGADIAIEAVGNPATVAMTVQSLRKGGQAALVGNVSPAVDLLLQLVVTRELTLYGSCASRLEFPVCLDLLERGVVDVEPLISAVAPLSEGIHWFERLRKKDEGLMKVILTP